MIVGAEAQAIVGELIGLPLFQGQGNDFGIALVVFVNAAVDKQSGGVAMQSPGVGAAEATARTDCGLIRSRNPSGRAIGRDLGAGGLPVAEPGCLLLCEGLVRILGDAVANGIGWLAAHLDLHQRMPEKRQVADG